MFFVMALNSAIYGLMIVPICEDFNITRAEFSLSRTYGSIASMIAALLVGKIYKRFSLKKAVVAGLITVPICFVVQGFSPNIYVFYAMAFIFGAAVTLTTSVAISTLINSWFEEKRGFALAMATMGSGFGGMLMNPLIGSMISGIGWRSSFFVLAAIVAVILIPVVVLLLKENPSDVGLQPYGSEIHTSAGTESASTDSDTGMTVAEAVKSPMFYCMAIVCAVVFGASNCIMLHTVAYATDIGFDYKIATGIATVLTLGTTISKPVMGKMFDKFGSRKAASLSLLFFALCLLLYFIADEKRVLVLLAALVFGFGSCFANLAPALITQDIFGRKYFASICGKWQVFGALGTAFLSPFVGSVYDNYGSYRPAWAFLACAMLACVFLVNLMFIVAKGKKS